MKYSSHCIGDVNSTCGLADKPIPIVSGINILYLLIKYGIIQIKCIPEEINPCIRKKLSLFGSGFAVRIK